MTINQHAKAANIPQHNFYGAGPNDFVEVQATLAISYEQRTANLLKFAEMLNELGRFAEANDILKQAESRLTQ